MSDSQHPPVDDNPEHLADLLMVDANYHLAVAAKLQNTDGSLSLADLHISMANHCHRAALLLRKRERT